MIRISFLIAFILLSFSSVRADESEPKQLPVLECKVESAAGNFGSYLRPMAGDTLHLDLNTIEAKYKKGDVLKFNDGGKHANYIPLSSGFDLTVLDNKLGGDRFYMRAKADISKGKITMDIHPLGDYGYQMFLVHETDLIYGVAFLTCTQNKK